MKKSREGFQKGKVVTISAVHFVHDCYTSFLAPALPLIIEKLGISYQALLKNLKINALRMELKKNL